MRDAELAPFAMRCEQDPLGMINGHASTLAVDFPFSVSNGVNGMRSDKRKDGSGQ
jgi:hypothetical protein